MTPRSKKKDPRNTTGVPVECAVCHNSDGTYGPDLNGLPGDVPACDECRAAVKRREVGVSINEDGTFDVTDGRVKPEGGTCPTCDQLEATGHTDKCPRHPDGWTAQKGLLNAEWPNDPTHSPQAETEETSMLQCETCSELTTAEEAGSRSFNIGKCQCGGSLIGVTVPASVCPDCDQAEAAGHAPDCVRAGGGTHLRKLWPNDPLPAPEEPGAPVTLVQAIASGLRLPDIERIAIVEEDWARVMAMLANVERSRTEHDDLKRQTSDAKRELEAAQAALERALGRIRDGLRVTEEPRLPFEAAPATDVPAGVPEASPEGLPFDGVHQSDVVQPASNIGRLVHFNHETDDAPPWKITAEGSIEGQPLFELEGMSGEFGRGLFRFADGAAYNGPPTLPDLPTDRQPVIEESSSSPSEDSNA